MQDCISLKRIFIQLIPHSALSNNGNKNILIQKQKKTVAKLTLQPLIIMILLTYSINLLLQLYGLRFCFHPAL